MSAAQARLPQEVAQQGVTVKKQSPSVLMLISVYSPTDSYDANFLINYSGINLRDQLLRIPGIAQVDLFGGTDYGMRIWFQPDKLAKLGLTPADVISAIEDQNIQAPAGQGRRGTHAQGPGIHQHGQRPGPPGHARGVREHHRPAKREWRSGPDQGHRPRGVGLPGLQRVRAAQWQTGRRDRGLPFARCEPAQGRRNDVHPVVERAKALFPSGMDYKIVYDTTAAVEAGIREIVETLVEAIALVMLVVFLFLQNLRATLIPLLTVPVSLVGTFVVFPVLGFSVNTLSLFGLVLAIGLVVDDATSWSRRWSITSSTG